MAKSTKKYTYLDEGKLNQIVGLLSFGLSQTAIAKIVGCSAATVSRVHTSGAKTMADLDAYRKQEREKRTPRLVEGAASDERVEEPVVTAPMKTHSSKDSLNLDRIANALERLATAWESQPTKRNIIGDK